MDLLRYITPSILIALAVMVCVFLFFAFYWRADLSRDRALAIEKPKFTFAGKRHPMERKDRLPLILITAVYAATAFFQLGDTRAPQKFWDLGGGESVTIEVTGAPVYTTGLRYYTGLGTGGYNVEISEDGASWSTLWERKDPDASDKVTGHFWAEAEQFDPSYALTQRYNELFKWSDIQTENPQNVQYLRITGKAETNAAGQRVLELGKLCLLGQDGKPARFDWTMADGSAAPEALTAALTVDDTVPEKSTWHNSTYFDEIYHARTAKENIDGVYPYEVTHPPLGKLILGLGIRTFGMTPFGWRFMGTLFGVGMLPVLYIFLKNLFGKTPVAACGTLLFAFDFMHLTQTRIATIDTYGVFFILCMYFFMYRYLTVPPGTPFHKSALPLFLSGLMWGLGAASKWTVIYGAIGLAAVYFIGLYQKCRDWPRVEGERRRRRDFTAWLVKTLLFSVLCFLLIPVVIYCASYIPYAMAKGVDLSLGNTLSGARESFPALLHNLWGNLTGGEGFQGTPISTDSLSGIVANNQWYMLTYHEGVLEPHPYSSKWYQWIVDARPILYYMDNDVAGYTTRFAAFGNPVVCWAGLLAVLTCMVQMVRRRSAKALFIVIAFFSQLAPWFAIGRTTFEYHYFPSILFLCFALAWVMDDALEHFGDRWKKPVYALTGLSTALYPIFYPVLIGLTIPTWYEPVVKWIESWPF